MLQARGTDTNLLQAINNQLGHLRSFRRTEKLGAANFSIVHYAGDVTYEIDGFVEKNKDAVSNLITECLAGSKQSIVQGIYTPQV